MESKIGLAKLAETEGSQEGEAKEENEAAEVWPAVLRGTVLSATMGKQMQFLLVADRRAQVLITIVSLLLPLVLSQWERPDCLWPILTFSCFSLVAMLLSILSLFPKSYRNAPDESCLLHFSRIARLDERQYLEAMHAELEDRKQLGKLVSLDIYHMSRDILAPKFRLLRLAYQVFAVGIALSLVLFVARTIFEVGM